MQFRDPLKKKMFIKTNETNETKPATWFKSEIKPTNSLLFLRAKQRVDTALLSAS